MHVLSKRPSVLLRNSKETIFENYTLFLSISEETIRVIASITVYPVG